MLAIISSALWAIELVYYWSQDGHGLPAGCLRVTPVCIDQFSTLVPSKLPGSVDSLPLGHDGRKCVQSHPF